MQTTLIYRTALSWSSRRLMLPYSMLHRIECLSTPLGREAYASSPHRLDTAFGMWPKSRLVMRKRHEMRSARTRGKQQNRHWEVGDVLYCVWERRISRLLAWVGEGGECSDSSPRREHLQRRSHQARSPTSLVLLWSSALSHAT